MNVLIATDMEGTCAVDLRSDLKKGTAAYDKSCDLLTQETNAAVQAAYDAGATKVFVNDGHSKGDNLLLDKLHPKAIHIPKEDLFGMITGIGPEIDVLAFIGFHGMANRRKSFLCHNNSGKKISQLSVNGMGISEGGLCAMMAKVYDIKVIFLSGTDTAVEEIRRHIPTLPALAVKQSLSYAEARSKPFDAMLTAIADGIREGIEKNEQIPFTTLPSEDVRVRIDVPYTYYLDALDNSIEGLTIVDDRAVEIHAKDALDFYKKYFLFRQLISVYLDTR